MDDLTHHHHSPSLPYPLESTIPTGPNASHEDSSSSSHHSSSREGHNFQITRKHIGSPSDPYAFLRHFDTVFLIDDSANISEHWHEVGVLLERIAPICTSHDPNGIDIYFVHHRPRGSFLYSDRSGYRHIGLARGTPGMRDHVAGIFAGVMPRGKSKLGHRLGYVLDHYMREYERSRKARGDGGRSGGDGENGGGSVRPLNVIVITAGGYDDDSPSKPIVRTARKLDHLGAPSYQVGVQFFLIGADEEARKAIEATDYDLSEELGMRDIADVVTWSGKPGELSPDALLKVVLGAVERSIDKQQQA
ncbi:hypothetical protein F5Y04DRAFT_292700 [Hypomontagnella monticulosa]|nr:hypothetical protein F5Y04DRAFT_292700 [Hypomontagnella monticulosa]